MSAEIASCDFGQSSQAARRRFSINESIEAAFGFTTQNFGRKVRRSLRISAAQTLSVEVTWLSSSV